MDSPSSVIATQVAVIGAGAGGYVAALRLADLGKKVLLIEQRSRLGGVCLIEGCIPSKSLIHAVELCYEAQHAPSIGITFSPPQIDLHKVREWKEGIISHLATGIAHLVNHRQIQVIHGTASFLPDQSLLIQSLDTSCVIRFEQCIIATGSLIHTLPSSYSSPCWTSADALTLPSIPKKLLVVGGGYIGLELGLVYAGLGSQVSIAEFNPLLLAAADQDLVSCMFRSIEKRFEKVMVDSKVEHIDYKDATFTVTLSYKGRHLTETYDQVLVAVGRYPHTKGLGLETVQVRVDEKGFIVTDAYGRTTNPALYAIGDVASGPMLAHKASKQAKLAADSICGRISPSEPGMQSSYNHSVPAVVFTDPEIAWTGITESETLALKLPVTIARFPLAASARALTMNRSDGLVKIISDKNTRAIVGVGMVGPRVSELIAEGALAIHLSATIDDIRNTIHPHPTLSEAMMEAAEIAAGFPIHTSSKKQIKKQSE